MSGYLQELRKLQRTKGKKGLWDAGIYKAKQKEVNSLKKEYDSMLVKKRGVGHTSKTVHPSKITRCMCEVWIGFFLPEEFHAPEIKRLEQGNALHQRIQRELDWTFPGLKCEQTLNANELYMTKPRVDAVLSDWVIEIKSASQRCWEEISKTKVPREYDALQLMFYEHEIEIHNGILIYERKETQVQKWMYVPYLEAVLKPYLDWFVEVKTRVKEKDPPIHLLDMNSKVCYSCKRRSICEQLKEGKSIDEIRAAS